MSISDEQRDLIRRARPAAGPVVPRRKRPAKAEFDEGPSEEDIERFSDVTVKCPSCGTELFDDAQICYQCGHAILGDHRKHLPGWVIVTLLIVILATLFTVMGPLASIF